MELGLTGRRALVAGASQGIGLGIARALAAEGCDVTLLARRADVLADQAAALEHDSGRRIGWIAADLTEPGAADTAVAAHLAALGGLDILVASAGASAAGDLSALTDAQWETGLAVKLHGTVRLCRAAMPALEASGRGVILPVIGAAWKTPNPAFLLGATVNAALAAFVAGLAPFAAARGVRVAAIHPGPVRTDRLEAALAAEAAAGGRPLEEVAAGRARAMGMTRLGTVADVAALACFLASDRAGHIHGAQVLIDGGQTRGL